jgi:hypothetical protein
VASALLECELNRDASHGNARRYRRPAGMLAAKQFGCSSAKRHRPNLAWAPKLSLSGAQRSEIVREAYLRGFACPPKYATRITVSTLAPKGCGSYVSAPFDADASLFDGVGYDVFESAGVRVGHVD